MEIKKSHKADLERYRPLMFLAGLVITLTLFFIVLEWQYVVDAFEAMQEEEIEMDLDIKANDDRDMIAAAQKLEQRKEIEDKSEEINKVDETTEMAPEDLEPVAQEKVDEENTTEEEPPVNLNDDDPEILRIVEELPQFPGGMGEFVKWLTAELKYPPVALRDKITGKVMVSFIVNKDGSISDIALVQHVNTYLDNEALRVVRKMPNWTPGKDHGVVCRTKVAVPIVFEI